MNIQEISQNISELRDICTQHELTKHLQILDAVNLFMETQIPIVSVAGARTSGKCAIVNSLMDRDILPSRIFKPHVLYRISNGQEQLKVRSSTGGEKVLRSIEDVAQFSKIDYDSTVMVETNSGLLLNTKAELRTGFDIEEKCPLLGCVLSDVVLYCVKASALFSIEDMTFIDGLYKMGHRRVLICVTHLNNVSIKEIPGIVKFVASKHLNYPVAYFSDELTNDVPDIIKANFGTGNIQQVVLRFLAGGMDNHQRETVAKSMLSDVIDDVVLDLTEKKCKLEQQKDRKYSAYLAKMGQRESMQLGWADIRIGYEKRETKCVETILTELNKAKSKVVSRIYAAVASVPSPKNWWEKVFPLVLTNEIDSMTSGIDKHLQSSVVRDFNWLNHELHVRFCQTLTSSVTVGETSLDFSLDPNGLSLSNLRTARYVSMVGGASLATALFFIVGPVGAVASASCSILGDRYIHKTIGEQRDLLKTAVANVIDDVFTKMSAMIPDRVNGLYEEIAREIAEKEQAWSKNNAEEKFSCGEIPAINKLVQTIEQTKNLK